MACLQHIPVNVYVNYVCKDIEGRERKSDQGHFNIYCSFNHCFLNPFYFSILVSFCFDLLVYLGPSSLLSSASPTLEQPPPLQEWACSSGSEGKLSN